MRGRKPKPAVKRPRAPRRKAPSGEGKRMVNLFGLPHYVIAEGPEQSVLWSVDDHTDKFHPREIVACNDWFSPWRVKLKTPRVKIKRRFRPGRETTDLRPHRFTCREDEE